jgi:mitotic spindle assembly checkpoint protein MAD2
MSSTATETKTEITLKGSVEIVTEFFGFAINNILYQRGIYPPDTFSGVAKYGLSLLVTTDEGLKSYLANVLKQLSVWLAAGQVQKLVIAIDGVESGETLERWVFNVQTDKAVTATGPGKEKSTKEIQGEIQALMRQITASVTFLPLLDEACAFDLLVYTNQDSSVPTTWEESDPKYISNSEEVRLRSFTTKVHKVDASVSYRAMDDEV